jgi:hypothetical protein
MTTTPARTRTRASRRTALGAITAVALSMGSMDIASASEPQVPPISPTQLQCLAGQHLDTSTLANHVTNAAIDTLLAAAGACGITIPPALVDELRSRVAEQPASPKVDPRLACLADQHLTAPAAGHAPTAEQIAAYRAALTACGLLTGGEAAHPAPPSALVGHDARPAATAPRAAPKAKANAKANGKATAKVRKVVRRVRRVPVSHRRR